MAASVSSLSTVAPSPLGVNPPNTTAAEEVVSLLRASKALVHRTDLGSWAFEGTFDGVQPRGAGIVG